MVGARMLAYITGTVDQELLLRNEYLAAENRIFKKRKIVDRLLCCGVQSSPVELWSQCTTGDRRLSDRSPISIVTNW
jgi:hypothetical protein